MTSIERFNNKLVKKLAKQLESKKSVFVSFEDYSGSEKDFEKALEMNGLDWEEKYGGNFKVVNK